MSKTVFQAPFDAAVPAPGPVRRRPGPFPRRILVAVDPEPAHQDAVSVAAAMADATGAELVLLGLAPVAVPPREGGSEQVEGEDGCGRWPAQRLLDDLARDRLLAVAAGLPRGIRVRATVDWGTRTGGLLHAIRVERPDLVVVPRPRGRLMRRLLMQHRARRVVHEATVPVLVVPVR